MKLLLSISSLAVGLVLAMGSARADQLTLDEAVRTAVEKSPQLEQSRASTDVAKWKKTEALSGFLPTVSAAGQWFFLERTPLFHANFGDTAILSLPPSSPWVDALVAVTVPVFNGFRNIDDYRSASLSGQAADLQLDWQTFNLEQQIRLAYNSVLEAEKLAEVAAEDVQDLKDHRRLVSDQLRAGVVTHVALLRVDTQLSNATSEKTNADDEVQIRRQQLAQYLGQEREDRSLVGELPAPSDEVMHAIEGAKLETRSDIDALNLQTEAGNTSHQSAAKWWVPSLNLVGDYAAFQNREDAFTAYAIGFQASWKLFDGLKSYSQAKEADASARVADHAHESARLQAITDFETYRRRYRYNLEKFRARSEDVTRSQESMRLARAGFKAGTQTNTDVLDAEQDLFNARASLIEAQYGALDALVKFELAVGKRVTHD